MKNKPEARGVQSSSGEQETPTIPIHGNWAEERGFGQQTSPAANLKQYELKLTDAPSSGGK